MKKHLILNIIYVTVFYFLFFFSRQTDKSDVLCNLRVIRDSNEVSVVNQVVQIECSAWANIEN